MRNLTLIAAVSGAVLGLLPLGADERINDVRLAAGYGPDRFHATGTLSNNGVPFDASQSNPAVRDERFALSYLRSLGPISRRGGWIMGGEISENIAVGRSNDVTDLDQTTRLRALILDVVAGYAVPLGCRWAHLELTPFVGTGYARTRYSFTAQNGDTYATTSQPSLLEYGARLGIQVTSQGGWQIGIDLRYSEEKTSLSAFGSRDTLARPTTITEDIRLMGVGGLISLGHRF